MAKVEDKIFQALTMKEESFCQAYVNLLGNGTQAVLAAGYGVDMSKPNAMNTAAAISKENLRKPHILKRVRELLDLIGMNNETVDAEINFCLRQNEDMSVKLRAADTYNRMAGRYEKDNAQSKPQIVLGDLLKSIDGGTKDLL